MNSGSGSLRREVEQRANGRCEYCHAPRQLCGYQFHLDHIRPPYHGGSNAASNRALACAACNLAKQEKIMGPDPKTGKEVPLFHPRIDQWSDHFEWADDEATILGRTATGRATVGTLDMNSDMRKRSRRYWFAYGWLP